MTATVGPAPVVVLDGAPVLPAEWEELGGKGAGLARLWQSGCKVPPAAVVTASAYRQVVSDPALDKFLAQVRDGPGTCSAAEVDRAFLDVRLPPGTAAAIVAAADAVRAGRPVAVRSSATVEDLATVSFAGQYRSLLNVDGPEPILRAVRLVWASLWHPAPCAYRRAWGVPAEGIAMPVVIMQMVPAVMAGVAFTVDPGGDTDRVRVESVAGLGDSLVSGARTPKVWLLPRDRPGGDSVPPAVRAVATEAVRLERDWGAPLDVEWAWDGARLWLVQARPVTTGADRHGDGSDTAVRDRELTTAGISEMLPGVLPPLLWDINSYLVEEALRAVLGGLWAVSAGGHGAHELIHRVHGRAALDLGLLKAAAAAVPGGSVAELERQYFGAEATDGSPAPPAPWWRRLRHQLRVAATRRHYLAEAEVILAAAPELRAGWPELTDWDEPRLLAYHRRLLDLGARAMTVELAVAAIAAAAYRELELRLDGYLGERDAARAAQQVTSGAGTPAPPGPGMSRSVFAGPTWQEAQEAPAPTTEPRAPAPTRRDAARAALERRLRSDPRWRRIRILTGQVVDVRMHMLRRLTSDATDGLQRRELVKAAVLQIGGEVRRVHLVAARRLVDRRLLEQVEDVDLLRVRELHAGLAGAAGTPPPAELARRRRWVRQWLADPALPVRFQGVPGRGAPGRAAAGDQLLGWGASPGRCTARARVVADPTVDRFEADEVLVAAATDAGWLPVMLRAAAVVVERGGPLSHAAIVARELGIPAVLNLPGATTALAGELVTVDGDAGMVTICREGGVS